jgi:hypothetical protein
MDYQRKLERVREAVKNSRSDMFYTPETKGDMNSWVAAMPVNSPTGIAVMVGFNYAIRQIERFIDEDDRAAEVEEALASVHPLIVQAAMLFAGGDRGKNFEYERGVAEIIREASGNQELVETDDVLDAIYAIVTSTEKEIVNRS